MKGHLLAALTCAALVTPASGAPVPKGLVTDRAKLEGRWRVEATRTGSAAPTASDGGFVVEYEFRGDRLVRTVTVAGVLMLTTSADVVYGPADARRLTTSGALTVTADGKPFEGGGRADGARGYALVGEKLLLAERPVDAGSVVDPLRPAPDDRVLVLVRVKAP